MKKTLLILISTFALTMSACNEEDEFTEVIPPSEETAPPSEVRYKTIGLSPRGRGIVSNIKEQVPGTYEGSQTVLLNIILSPVNTVTIPETFELTLDKNDIYHLTGDMTTIAPSAYVNIVFPISRLDSVEVIDGPASVGGNKTYYNNQTLRLGVKGPYAYMDVTTDGLNEASAYLTDGGFSASGDEYANKMYIYDYTDDDRTPVITVDSLYYYNKTAKPYTDSFLQVAKYLTGPTNSAPFVVKDISCNYNNPNIKLEIDPLIQSIVSLNPDGCTSSYKSNITTNK